MSKPEPKPSRQITVFCRLIELLAGHEFEPLRNSEIARALGISAPEATRFLRNGIAAGWVEKTPDGLYRLAPRRITNIAVAVQHGIQRARSKFDDQATNYTRSIY